MALVKCSECKNLISNTASACPTCGKPKQKSYSIWSLLGLIFLGWIAYNFYQGYSGYSEKSAASNGTPEANTDICSAEKVTTEIHTFSFEDKCTQSQCFYMKGAATVKNTCLKPIGAMLKITGYDSAGKPISTREFWPNSTHNLAMGDTVISLDQMLDYDPSITKISLKTVKLRDWKK